MGNHWNQFNGLNPYLERYGTEFERSAAGDLLVLEQSTDPAELYQVTQHHWYKEMSRKMKTVSIKDFLLNLIHVSTEAFKGTARQNTFVIWHDRLSILWDKSTQAWLKTLKCPIQGWQERTWANRFIRFRGAYNDGLTGYYQNSLPGDSPELMPLDSHLFSDIIEGVSRNVAFFYFLGDNNTMKYSLATPKQAFRSIQRTIKAGCPPESRITEDIEQIPETMQRIIEAEGAYIEDGSRKGGQKAVEFDERCRKTVDEAVMAKFFEKMDSMCSGNGVPFSYDEDTEVPLVELEAVDC